MNRCQDQELHLESLFAGALPEDARRALDEHAATCPSCRELLALHDTLTVTPHPEPTDAAFASMRARVLLRLRQEEAAGRRALPWGRIAALAAALLLAALLGYAGGQTGGATPGHTHSSLVAELDQRAAENVSFADSEATPYVFRNLRLRTHPNGQVGLRFELATELELERPIDDPLVRELLVQSLLDRDSLVTRFDALALAPRVMDPIVQSALERSLREDPSPAVRAHALTVLAELPPSEALVDLMLAVLGEDEAVQLRLLAIDYLASAGLSQDTLRDTILEAADTKQRPALLSRLADAIDS